MVGNVLFDWTEQRSAAMIVHEVMEPLEWGNNHLEKRGLAAETSRDWWEKWLRWANVMENAVFAFSVKHTRKFDLPKKRE
jgi:hypothetical protein